MQRLEDLFVQLTELSQVKPYGHVNTTSGKVKRTRGMGLWRSFVNQEGETRFENIKGVGQLLDDTNEIAASLLHLKPLDMNKIFLPFEKSDEREQKERESGTRERDDITVAQQQYFSVCDEKVKNSLRVLRDKLDASRVGINQLIASTYAGDASTVARLFRLHHYCTLQIRRIEAYCGTGVVGAPAGAGGAAITPNASP